MSVAEVTPRSAAGVPPRSRAGTGGPGAVGASWRAAPAQPAGPPADEQAAFAVVLHLDDDTDAAVRRVWARLEEEGVPSVATTYGPGYRPHLTLAIVDTPHPGLLAERLRPRLDAVPGLDLTLSSLGFFLTPPGPAYLAVTPSRHLLGLHESVHDVLTTADSWSYYRPGSWVPHCTLAMGVDSPTTVARALGNIQLPIHATVTSAHLTRLPRVHGHVVEPLALTADKQTSLLPAQHRAGPRHKRPRRLRPSRGTD